MSMRFDVQNQLCDEQAFTATAVSENSYKKQSAAQDISIGRRMALLVLPTISAGAGSTHILAAVQADVTALTTNIEVLGSVTVLAANLTTDDQIEIPIPQGSMTRQFLGFRDTISGGATTVTLDVYLVPQDEIPEYKSFPRGPIASV